MATFRPLPPALAAALVLAGCGAAPVPAAPPSAPGAARALLQAAEAPATWAWEPREDAPWSAFERGDRPPTAHAFHLDFHLRQGAGDPTGDHQVAFADGVPFVVRLVEGPAFAVLDHDATDGEAAVALPSGTHEGWLARLGEPGGTLDVADPTYFRRETLAMDRGKREWVRLGAHTMPFPYADLRGPAELRLTARGLTGFATRWGAGAPEVPPLPPLVVDLTTPAELVAGERGDVRAVLADGVPAPTDATYTWHATDPDARPAGSATTAGPALAWLAPDAPGRYLMDLAVATPWFRAKAPAPKPIRVRRELFLDSYAPPAKPFADAAVAVAQDSWPLTAGVAFDLAAEGTMNNTGGTATCGAPEARPWWGSPGRPNGVVNLDPAYFFAGLAPAKGCAPTFALVATNLIGFNVDGGATWSATRPREGAYQPSHRYTYPAVTGRGKPLRARCMDPRVWDNWGRFKITIRRPG